MLGNLLFAILMRNELFGRILYAVVNFCFAKVCHDTHVPVLLLTPSLVDTTVVPPRLHVSATTHWRHPLWLRFGWLCLAYLQGDPHLHRP